LQYPLGVNFGIDLFFFNTNEIVETANPGRMAPNSALTHVFAFLTLMFFNWRKVLSTRIAGVISAIVLSSGTISLMGYLIGSDRMFNWGHYTQMAAHTSVGFLVAGMALILLIVPQLKIWLREKTILKFYFWPYLAVFLTAVFLIDMQMPQDVSVGLIYAIVVMRHGSQAPKNRCW
jgi:hypothetical protein